MFNLIFILLNISSLYACETKLYSHVYLIGQAEPINSVINSNCEKEVVDKLVSAISNLKGQIKTNQLTEIADIQSDIEPQMIHVYHLEDIINKNIHIQDGHKLIDIKSTNGIQSIISNSPLNLDIKCISCTRLGKKTVKVINKSKTYWFSGTLATPTKVWVPKRNFPALTTGLTKDDFKEEVVFAKNQRPYFQEIKEISFYQTTRYLKKGEPVEENQLKQMLLVRHGQKIELTVKGSQIRIETFGIAKRDGYLNEFVEVLNPKTKKTYLAKIIDFNKGMIEL